MCKKGEEMMYLQVSYLLESESTKQREFAPLLEIGDSWKKYVITMDENASGFIDGVQWINIIDFLVNIK
ncbi:ATP-binding protein [bacterium]|nr:ATP-binding protein [bacterium]